MSHKTYKARMLACLKEIKKHQDDEDFNLAEVCEKHGVGKLEPSMVVDIKDATIDDDYFDAVMERFYTYTPVGEKKEEHTESGCIIVKALDKMPNGIVLDSLFRFAEELRERGFDVDVNVGTFNQPIEEGGEE